MKRTTPYWLLILLYCTPLISYAEEYAMPPPAGVQWGWQGQLFFDLNSAKIHQEYQSLLNQIVEIMTQTPQVSLLVTGRADNTGNAEYNKRLSLKRIQRVVDYLTQRGVQAEHVHTQALGERRPVSSNACFEDRQRNRRVDLAFFPTGAQPPTTAPAVGDTQPLPGECDQTLDLLIPE